MNDRTGELALKLWEAAMAAIKLKHLDEAEKLAGMMWLPSDAGKVREKIAAARANAT